MNKKIVTLVGNIGSGKSTALPMVARHFEATTVDADDLFQTSDPFAKLYLKDMSRWAFTNELWLTVKRVSIITRAIETSTKKMMVVDSGLLMSWVYSYSHFLAGRLTEQEWNLYAELYDQLSMKVLDNSAVVFFDYSISTLLQRIKSRGRAYELEYYNEGYLAELQAGLDALVALLKRRHIQVIIISEQLAPDFVQSKEDAATVLTRIEHQLKVK